MHSFLRYLPCTRNSSDYDGDIDEVSKLGVERDIEVDIKCATHPLMTNARKIKVCIKSFNAFCPAAPLDGRYIFHVMFILFKNFNYISDIF